MMAAGKTTVGKALAQLTGWPYLDNDELVRRAAGRSTPDVLTTAGEQALRSVESAALDEALFVEPPLIAGVAAGVVADPEARQRLREDAFVVYLRAEVSQLAERVGSGRGRPWLGDDPTSALERLYEGREPLYREAADLVLDVDGLTPERLALAIAGTVRGGG